MQNKKSKAMFLSIIPGLGHMYLGLMNQGVQIMFTFFLTMYLGDLLEIGLIKMLIPVIWFYCMFDVRNKACSEEKLNDSQNTIFSYINSGNGFSKSTDKLIGYTLIFIGLISIFDKIVMPYISEIFNYQLLSYIRTIFVSVVLIGIGGFLLSKSGIKNITRGGDDN